jgi:hypothetical protein
MQQLIGNVVPWEQAAEAGGDAQTKLMSRAYPKLMFGSPWASSPVVVRLQVPPRGAPAL